MKDIIENLEEAKTHMQIMSEMEDRFKLLKKQCLAHEIYEAIKSSDFEEVKFVGEVSDQENYNPLPYGCYFDAKTHSEDYTGVDIDKIYDDEFDIYQERLELSSSADDNFAALSKLQLVFDNFIYQQPGLKDVIMQELQEKPFKVEFKSILRAIMTEAEFGNYLIVSEKEDLQKSVEAAPKVENSKKIGKI